MNTGSQVFGRPSVGSWLTYGLGSESRDLPGFVVLLSGENAPDGGKSCWGSGFLPSVYQGVEFRSKGDPVLFVSNPDGVDTAARRESIDLVGDLNRLRRVEVGDPEIDTRIASYEMAYRMQSSVPELTDISERAGADPRDVRHRARQGVVREQLPAGAPSGRARRALRAALSPRLGHARRQRRDRHRDESSGALSRDRSRRDRPGARSQAAGSARHDARHLGRGVRPHADERSARRLAADGARSPSAGVHDLDGRRRRQAGRHGRPHGRPRVQRRRRSGRGPRPARHDPALDGAGSHEADLQVPGARVPADRRAAASSLPSCSPDKGSTGFRTVEPCRTFIS